MQITDSLTKRLHAYSNSSPNHPAIVTPAYTLSYQQLATLLELQAERIQSAGFKTDSVVGIKCADEVQHLVLCLAASYLGLKSCTIPTYEEDYIQNKFIQRCGVDHLLDEGLAIDPVDCISNGLLDKTAFKSVEPRFPPAELLFSTSGTTGEAKFVIHHDSDLVAQAHRHIGSSQERFCCISSIEHNFAKRHRLYCLAQGATNIFLDSQSTLTVDKIISLDVNVLHVSAFQAQELLAMPNVNRLRDIRLKLGGSHVSPELRVKLRSEITSTLQAGYGTTETGAIAFTDPKDSESGSSVGKALSGIEIQAVSPDRVPLDLGERGELAIRCEGMFRGYLGQPDITASRLANGWFYTGDIGYLDKEKRIYLSGRSDDMFVFNSINIFPQDIESELCKHPKVLDALVVPKPSSTHGEIPTALVVLSGRKKGDIFSLKKFMKKCVGLRHPRQYIVVDEIPRNASGKVIRGEAVQLSVRNEQVRSHIVQTLESQLNERFKSTAIDDFKSGEQDITLHEINLDSLSRMELLVALEVEYGTIIGPTEFLSLHSLGGVAAKVMASLSSQTKVIDKQNVIVFPRIENISSQQEARRAHVVRLFQRVFRYCHTVAQLNKALLTFEGHLTPEGFWALYECHAKKALIKLDIAEKFHITITSWCESIAKKMLDCGKEKPELFVAKRITPTVTHFSNSDARSDKTLVVCFSTAGYRQLMIPNAVLMQHADAKRFDFLIIAEPLNQAYWKGVPSLGGNVSEVVTKIASLDLLSQYKKVRTLGCSAGAFPAVVLAGHIDAEMAVSVGGRFHSERYLMKILSRMYTIWRSNKRNSNSSMLMVYARDNNRDRRYANIVSRIVDGKLFALKLSNQKLGHAVFSELAERGELALFLKRTVFADMHDDLIVSKKKKLLMTLPANKVRLYS